MPFDPGAAGVRIRHDELGDLRQCHQCGQPVRRSYHRELGLELDLDPDPQPVDPTWSPAWSSLTWRWHERIGWCSVVFGVTTKHVHVAHPCGVHLTL